MSAQLKKAFFDHIKARRDDLESQAKRTSERTFRNIEHPGQFYDWVLYVGGFLLEEGVINSKDLDRARALVIDYSDRLETLFPQP